MENNESVDFNLGSGTGYTVLEMVEALQKVIGRKIPYEIAERREGDPAVLVASSRKAEKLLGWKAGNSSMEQMLQSAWKWEENRRYG